MLVENKVSNSYFSNSRDINVPNSLDDLKGEYDSILELPIEISWSGTSIFDIKNDTDCRIAYREIINNGSLEDVKRLINKDRLNEVWEGLMLPINTQLAWEGKFPEIRKWLWQDV